jgi:hypothetical protein
MKTRGELKRDYMNTPPPMGVFVIRNKTMNRFQVRATRNLPGAMNRVRFEMTHTSGPSKSEIMDDWRALGPEAFEIEVLDVLEPKKDAPGWDPTSDLEELQGMWHARLVDEGATPYYG